MARPRASGTPARVTAKHAQRRNLATTTGAVGGGGLAAYASSLPEPYARILIVFAPTISVLVARYGPSFLDACASLVDYLAGWAKHRAAVSRLRAFLRDARKKLEQPELSAGRRALIERRIAETEAAIDDREYRQITPFLLGDSQSGLRETDDGERPSSSTPGDGPDG